MVCYEVTPETAEANRLAVEKVMVELAEARPEGLSYTVHGLDDGVGFVHVAEFAGAENPLTESAAFAEFQQGLPARLVAPPVAAPAAIVGRYHSA